MQDLSGRVQSIASIFYETRSDKAFTDFYNILLPEAYKMLRPFIKDTQTIEDIASKIFETILTKPSIYFDDLTQQQFMETAAGFFGVTADQVELYHKTDVVPVNTKNFFDSNANIENVKIAGNVSFFTGKAKKTRVEIFYAPKEGVKARCHKNGKIPYTAMGKLWLLMNNRNYKVYLKDESGNRINLEENENKPERLVEIKLTKDNLPVFDLSQLSDAQAPFIYSLYKPFLHYFSRVVKTNALSHLKKLKKYKDQHFSDLYNGYDEDDRSQLIANQMSDEREHLETEHNLDREALDVQKFIIVFDIIQNTVPENQRGIMIDAILMKMDYKQICTKYKLETVGCVKSRVHRFKKRLDQEIAKTPHFTSKVDLGVYTTYFEGGSKRMVADVCETQDTDGIIHSIWHGHYVTYYSTGEVKEIGRFYINQRQGNYYQFYKNGAVMKRGEYSAGKPVGVWHEFDIDGKLTDSLNNLTGYYEKHEKNGDVISGVKDSVLLPIKERKPSLDEIEVARLCAQYDSELSYPTLHFEI